MEGGEGRGGEGGREGGGGGALPRSITIWEALFPMLLCSLFSRRNNSDSVCNIPLASLH